MITMADTVTIYFDNSLTQWSNVSIYVWDVANDNNVWPGELMTKPAYGGNLWSYTLEADHDYTGVIFNNGVKNSADATAQSANLTLVNTDSAVYDLNGYLYNLNDKGETSVKYFDNLDFESCEAVGDVTEVAGWTIASGLTAQVSLNTEITTVNNYYLILDGGYNGYPDMTILSQRSKQMLPAGKYTLSATIDAGNDDKDEIALFASYGDTTVETRVDFGSGTEYLNSGKTVLTFELEEDAYVTIGVKTAADYSSAAYLWLYADNFYITDERVSITVTDCNYATYFSVHSFLMPEGVQGAVATDYKDNGDTTGVLAINWKYDSGSEVPGQTALLIRAVNQTEETTYYGHVVRNNGAPDEENSGNLLHGSAEQVITNVNGSSEGYYFYKLSSGDDGANPGFFWASEDYDDISDGLGGPFMSDPHKAWLALPKTAETKLTALSFSDFSEETTGIHTVNTPAATGKSGIYTLQGTRVSHPGSKGIYITGGRKVIMK